MSEMSRSARRALRAKAHRLANARPEKVDCSSYGGEEDMKADVRTGMRPVSRRAYKSGGKVEGDKPAQNAGKKPRASGGKALGEAQGPGRPRYEVERTSLRTGKTTNLGEFKQKETAESLKKHVEQPRKYGPRASATVSAKEGPRPIAIPDFVADAYKLRKGRASGGKALVDDFVNRNDKDANEAREGEKHTGGLKCGGRAKRATGGNAGDEVPQTMFNMQPTTSRMVKAAGLASGGQPPKPKPSPKPTDDGWDDPDGGAPLPPAPKQRGGACAVGSETPTGGRTPRKSGGGNWIKDAVKHPGALHRELHVPEGEKIPAKKLTQALHSSNPTEAKRARLAKTLGRMHKATGGSAEAMYSGRGGDSHKSKPSPKTNINIVIAAGPRPAPVPAPGLPDTGVGGLPGPGAPPPMAAPAPAAAGAPPPMGPNMGANTPLLARKTGGRAYRSYKDMDAGAESGLGRLEKTAIAKRKK